MLRLIAVLGCAAALGAGITASGAPGSTPAKITSSIGPARLLTPSFGYAVAYRRVDRGTMTSALVGVFTDDHGRWSNVTPPGIDANGGPIDDVTFVDARHGWVAAYNCGEAAVHLFRTSDGGRSWQALGKPAGHSCGGGPTYLSFIDARTGWMEPVSPNGPGGSLYRTNDAGTTWSLVNSDRLPCLAPIEFVSASAGWISRCPPGWKGSGVFTTLDGGAHWRRAPVVRHGASVFDIPRFFGKTGVLPTTAAGAVTFSVSHDGGRTWSLRSRRAIASCSLRLDLFQRPTVWPASVASARVWWVVSGRTASVQRTGDGGRTWHAVQARGLPGGCAVTNVSAVDTRHAWVVARTGNGSALFATDDGGRSWRRAPLVPR